jgi:hypothetical protein
MLEQALSEIVLLRQALRLPESRPRLSGDEPVRPVEAALFEARVETGVDLGSSRVRVGFTRGHLLEVVVQVPLDVEGDEEALQVASEIFLEACVGCRRLDTWVASVSVDRIARTKGLLMVSDARSTTSAHPLEEAARLIDRGISAVWEGLPESVVDAAPSSDWTVLEIPPVDEGLQPDREFASTCFPEGLKAALEGLPFSSARFTSGLEIFVWLAWQADRDSVSMRLSRRTGLERALSDSLSGQAKIVGSGFGLERDFLDVWVRSDHEALLTLVRTAHDCVGTCELGFYDSALRPCGFTCSG